MMQTAMQTAKKDSAKWVDFPVALPSISQWILRDSHWWLSSLSKLQSWFEVGQVGLISLILLLSGLNSTTYDSWDEPPSIDCRQIFFVCLYVYTYMCVCMYVCIYVCLSVCMYDVCM